MTTCILAEKITRESVVMISWWGMGPQDLHSAGRQEEKTSAFHTSPLKQEEEFTLQRVEQQRKGRRPEVQTLSELGSFLGRASAFPPVAWLVTQQFPRDPA